MGEDLKRLKQSLPLLEYLRRHNWNARPAGTAQEFVGLCPLHQETRPSFYVNARKNLFYCHGCGRGGGRVVVIGKHELIYMDERARIGRGHFADAHAEPRPGEDA